MSVGIYLAVISCNELLSDRNNAKSNLYQVVE